jgi:hypothetical protein
MNVYTAVESWSASRSISLPHLAGGGYRRWQRNACWQLQDRQNQRELLWMVFSRLIDVIVKHVPSGWISEPAFMAAFAGIQRFDWHGLWIAKAVAAIWRLHPDWRLGQLVANIAAWSEQDVWDVEEDTLMQEIQRHLDQAGVAASK